MASVMNEVAVTMTRLVAVMEFKHKDLCCDEAGRLFELPGLLDPVNTLLTAFSALVDSSIECDLRPYSMPGCYGFELRTEVTPQSGELFEEGGEVDPFHAQIDRLQVAWQKIEANAKSDSPQQLKDIDVSEREYRTLKAIASFKVHHVHPELRTEDGRTSELPDVDAELLGKIKGPDPDDQWIDWQVTGVTYAKDDTIMLQLKFARWVKAPHLRLSEIGNALASKPHAVGILSVVEGAYVFRGDKLNDTQRSAPLPFGQP